MQTKYAKDRVSGNILNVFFITLMLGFFTIAMFLGYFYWQQCTCRPDNSYEYSINQSQYQQVKYTDSSVFSDTNLTDNRAYVTTLTDSIKSNFNYKFQGSLKEGVYYNNEIVARVSAGYLSKGSNQAEEVWARNYILEKTDTTKIKGSSFRLNSQVDVPYKEYFDQIRKLEVELGMPLIGELKVSSSTKVWSPEIKELSIKERQQYTASLDVPVFKIEQKITKQKNDTVGLNSGAGEALDKWLLIGVVASVILGIFSAILVWANKRSLSYGQLFKTSYQKELARIYRYHDSIIIKAREPIDTSGKEVVELSSFNDLLNIEDQLNLPIIASTISPSATMFTISYDNIVYAYKIGRVTVLPKGAAPRRGKKR